MQAYRLTIATIGLITLLIISAFAIPEWISPFQIDGIKVDLLWNYRIPKTFTALIAGASLSVSGFILQQLYKNNLAGPYILGVSSGASLAVAILIIGSHYFPFLNHGIGISLAGFIGATSILLLVMLVSSRFGSGAIILLFGVIIGQITGALQGLLNYMAVPGDLKNFTLWSMGSFSQVIEFDLLFFGLATLSGIAWAWFMMPQLSTMLLGDEVAYSLGVNTKNVSLQLLICTGILSGIATAYCGPIAFIGMAIPNVSRLLIKTVNFRYMLFVNAALGASMALISDIISSSELFGFNIPVNVVTALIGGPFIIYILLKRKH
jgi:iron complex transport system permease protein